ARTLPILAGSYWGPDCPARFAESCRLSVQTLLKCVCASPELCALVLPAVRPNQSWQPRFLQRSPHPHHSTSVEQFSPLSTYDGCTDIPFPNHSPSPALHGRLSSHEWRRRSLSLMPTAAARQRRRDERHRPKRWSLSILKNIHARQHR